MKVKEESGKVGLKLNIPKTKMASDLITSWEIDGETVETVSYFIFLGSKSLQTVTAAMKLKDAYSFNFMAAITICSDFEAQENKVCHCFHCFPINFP